MERKICRWDHPEDYKYTDDHDVRDWGWEFVRRNPLYIKDWKWSLNGFQSYKDSREIILEIFCFCHLAILSLEKKGLDINHSYVDRAKEFKKRMAICKKLGINIINPQQFETFETVGGWTKWGLHTHQDPDAKKLTMCNKAAMLSTFHYVSTAYDKKIKMESLEKGWCDARINLAKPILPQIENIKRITEMNQKSYKEYVKRKKLKFEVIDTSRREKPIKKDLWKNYIRCLDAHERKAKRKEAANTIFTSNSNTQTPEKMWDETLKQAKVMVASGFRPLMF